MKFLRNFHFFSAISLGLGQNFDERQRGHTGYDAFMEDIPEIGIDDTPVIQEDTPATGEATSMTSWPSSSSGPHCPYPLLSWECAQGPGPSLANT